MTRSTRANLSQEVSAEPDDYVEPDISSAEYQAQVVAWYRYTGQTIAEVAQALNLSESLVREWVWHASSDQVQSDTRPEWARDVNGEAVARAEARAAHAQARYESVCAELGAARAEITILKAAEAAARDEIKSTYAEAVEAIIRAELAAEQKIEEAKLATAAKAVMYARAVAAEAFAQVQAVRADACLPAPDPSPARVQDRQTVVVI